MQARASGGRIHITKSLGKFFKPAGHVDLHLVGNSLIFAGVLAIAVLAVFISFARMRAVLEAKESAKIECRPFLYMIYRVEGESEMRASVGSDDCGWSTSSANKRFTYELDGGWIVRLRGDKLEAVLSRGYWRDLVSGARLAWFIVGLVAVGLGVALRGRERNRRSINPGTPQSLAGSAGPPTAG